MMNMMIELGRFCLHPPLVGCVAVASILLACVVYAAMRKKILCLSKLLDDRNVELTYVEKKLERAEAPVLFNSYKGFEKPVPLGRLHGKLLRSYKEPGFANILKFATALADDPEAINELAVVLETDRGAFVRTLEPDAVRSYSVNEEGMWANARWEPISCGQCCKVDIYIVFRDLILRYVDHRVSMKPGDVLNVNYKLNPSDFG